jgi:hypothetical protein
MLLLGRAEVILHAKVQLQSTSLKPNATAGRERFRLRDLNQSEYASIESTRSRFLAARHCELDVIQRQRFTHVRNLARGRDVAKRPLSGKSCGAAERRLMAG